MKKALLLALVIIATLMMGCQEVNETDQENKFDPTEVQVGDEIGGFRITELEVGNDGPNYSVVAWFEGRAILKGKFVQYEGHEFLGDAATFEVDEANSDHLPKLVYDDRYVWFAFSNREEAIKLLEEYDQEGLTIEIDGYKIHYAPTEVVNEASIVKVVDGIK